MKDECYIILLIILGLLLGGLFYVEHAVETLKFLNYDEKTFFLFLLPPIILEAAYSLRDRAFVENIGTILLFAVVGTLLNIFLVGPVLYLIWLIGGGVKISFIECLIFSSLIAAVDPVAVLAIFQELGVNKMLYFMVFGESLFNDAVTVVIYNMMVSFLSIDQITISDLFLGVAAFFALWNQ
uniref:Cation/H+ exchanger domain-containing protein n=1 Tax=Romanomermis culicivorax TaxID=13658 RepID=A0A915I6J1_ROMCU